jgi:threonyl-tRNA synthetase
VQAQIKAAGYYADIDNSEKTLVRRIRDGQTLQYNFMLLVGDDDRAKSMVSIRTRDNLQQGMSTIPDLLAKFAEQTAKFK